MTATTVPQIVPGTLTATSISPASLLNTIRVMRSASQSAHRA